VAADMGAEEDWMEVHPLLTEGFVVAAPKGMVRADRETLKQLKQLPLVQYTTRHYMGRLIAAHLARQNLTLAHRFELDSYHAILAMVAQGAGWTILTPLALARAKRFRDAVDVMDLPFAPLTRSISLTARRGILGDMPARVATQLIPVLDEVVVRPMVAAHPWMEARLRLA